MTSLLALAAEGGPSLWTFFGRFHPATVHFPIAMLSIAALLEFLQIVRRKPALSPSTFTLTTVAAISAILATLMGLANASGRRSDDVLEAHRWAGIATTVFTLAALVLVVRARAAQGAKVQVARGSLFLGLILVSITGHWGGVLVYGESYYRSAWPWAKPEPEPLQMPATTRVDFQKDIVPILQKACFKCHGGEKSGKNGKGGLKLTTRALAMKGGDGGPCIEPGDPAKSSFYTLLLEKDPDKRMPEKADPLPKGEIETIRRWIEQGAVWPEGVEIKK